MAFYPIRWWRVRFKGDSRWVSGSLQMGSGKLLVKTFTSETPKFTRNDTKDQHVSNAWDANDFLTGVPAQKFGLMHPYNNKRLLLRSVYGYASPHRSVFR